MPVFYQLVFLIMLCLFKIFIDFHCESVTSPQRVHEMKIKIKTNHLNQVS